MLARYLPLRGVDWYLTDDLGTVRDISSSAGAVVNHIDYDSFGRVISGSHENISDRFLFVGREFDSDIGLYFLRARFYDPSLGRFVSTDPVGFEGHDYNLYRYANNNPSNDLDSFGEVSLMGYLRLAINAIATRLALYTTTAAPLAASGLSQRITAIFTTLSGRLGFATTQFFGNNLQRLSNCANRLYGPLRGWMSSLPGGRPSAEHLFTHLTGQAPVYGQPIVTAERLQVILRGDSSGGVTVQVINIAARTLEKIRFPF